MIDGLQPESKTEWTAWQAWHTEFRDLTGRDINDSKCNRFVSLTKIWGERLVKLRESQAPQIHSENVISQETAKLDAQF